MTQKVETIIIGGGQAGLATSYHLSQRSRENIVLEKAAWAAPAWRNDRWDSFTLLTPNWAVRLPGAEYRGDKPDGFMPREEIVATFENYIARFHLPVRYQAQATSVEALPSGASYRVIVEGSELEARNVVVATGLFQRPKKPAFSAGLSPHITQLHSGEYRNPQAIPPGGVLVVGSGQSGSQIAEELYLNGRPVYLSVSSAGRVPRRYRGKDIYQWMELSGFLDRTADKLPEPKARFAANPHLTGQGGGRTLNLHQFARDGVTLLGRMRAGQENKIWLAGDLKENLAKADKVEADLVKLVDGYIAKTGLDAPLESLPVLSDGFMVDEISELDLDAAGIRTIIWAAGYEFDFNFVKLPVFDSAGYPIQQRGVTAYPGLYFVGLPWLYKYKSGHLVGVGEDADYIAAAIAAREHY